MYFDKISDIRGILHQVARAVCGRRTSAVDRLKSNDFAHAQTKCLYAGSLSFFYYYLVGYLWSHQGLKRARIINFAFLWFDTYVTYSVLAFSELRKGLGPSENINLIKKWTPSQKEPH
jgi:hypothetical protein